MKKSQLAFIVISLIFIAAGISEAAVIDLGNISYGNETRMYQVYNAIYGTSYANNDAIESLENDSLIAGGLFNSPMQLSVRARYAGAALTLKYYDGSGTYDIFNNLPGNQMFYNPVSLSYRISADGQFGLIGSTYLGGWSSQNSLNSDNKYHFLVLNTPDPNKFLVGFEDMSNGGDWDYNDAVFEISKTHSPEPASLALVGLGLFGFLRFRKKKV